MDGASCWNHTNLEPTRIYSNRISPCLLLSLVFIIFLFPISLFFGVHIGVTAPLATRSTSTALLAQIPVEDRSTDQTEIYSIGEKWSKVRLMSREEADKLEPEWKEAYNRYFTKYEEDMTKMTEIATKIQKMIEPPKLQKKTDGQRRRDAYAVIVAREAARAARKPN
jgi:hypothetical protein